MTRYQNNRSLTFTVRVTPRSSRSEIVGEFDGAVKVKLTSPPVDGAANSELIRLFAKEFGVPKSAVEIVSGQSSKTKVVRVTGAGEAQLKKLVEA